MTRPMPGMTLTEWSAAISQDLRSIEVTVYNGLEDWRSWGNRTVGLCAALKGAPLASNYSTWQEWASAVIGATGQ